MLHIDFETYCDIDVREVGAQAYARHRSCEVLMMSWAYDNDEPELWLPEGPWDYDCLPNHLHDSLARGPICAHNIEFELNILRHVLGIHPKLRNMHDTAALALVNGLPKSLAGAGAALDLPVQKDTRGGFLIRKFCTPRKPTQSRPSKRNWPWEFPTDWLDFQNYCKTDTATEQGIWHELAG